LIHFIIGQRKTLIEELAEGLQRCVALDRKQKQTILSNLIMLPAAEMFNLSRKGFSAIILQLPVERR
jgi:hypothetical protein